MMMTLEVSGLNLEHLLNLAIRTGIFVCYVQRQNPRSMRLKLPVWQRKRFFDLCVRYGWEITTISSGQALRLGRRIKNKPCLFIGAALYLILIMISSGMIWQIRIDNADKSAGEIRRFLNEARITAGRLKHTVSMTDLREQLMLRVPDLAYVAIGYEGSRLVLACQPSLEGEEREIPGRALDIIAEQDGVITRIVVESGTPVVTIGQTVRAGDVLIRGEERREKGSVHPVLAQGEVTARVWSRGDARVSRYLTRTVETGLYRKRVTMISPWHRHIVAEAEPFEAQDVSVEKQNIVGLYLPLWREKETYAEIVTVREERSIADALSMAQGAAEQLAKNKCPSGVHILDKSVENSMIDDEYLYATVVLAYEDSIAVRRDHEGMIRQ